MLDDGPAEEIGVILDDDPAEEIGIILDDGPAEEVGVMLDDGPADELRASTGCTAELQLRENWCFKWFMCLFGTTLKGEARERATKERTTSGKCTSIVSDTMS